MPSKPIMDKRTPRRLQPYTLAIYAILALVGLFVLSGCDIFPSTTPNTIEPSATSRFGPVIQPDHTQTTLQNSSVPPTQPSTQPPTSVPTAGPTSRFGPIVGTNAVQPASNTPLPGQPTATLPPTATQTPIPPTLPPPPTTNGTPGATFGAIVGPNYTPGPTFTPVVPTPVTPANVTLPPPVTPGPSSTPGPVLRSDLMGVQINEYLTNPQWMNALGSAHSLGVGWIKVQVQWKAMET